MWGAVGVLVLVLLTLAVGVALVLSRDCGAARMRRWRSRSLPQPTPLRDFRSRYHRSKVPPELDVIVVGSGIGGLATAALLAQQGKRVLVLEQHTVAGGTTHAFTDTAARPRRSHSADQMATAKEEQKKCSDDDNDEEEEEEEREAPSFETGLHYVGHLDALARRVLDRVAFRPIRWTPLPETFDRILIGARSYPVRRGYAAFEADLVRAFPEERAAIRAYLETVRRCASSRATALFYALKVLPRWLGRWARSEEGAGRWLLGPQFFRDVDRSVADVVGGLTSNAELRAVLCGQFADYGASPESCPFQFAAQVVHHYLVGGAWYPTDGPGAIAASIVPTIELAGGRVLTGRGVAQILLAPDGGRVLGVRLAASTRHAFLAPEAKEEHREEDKKEEEGQESGDVILAPVVVAACGVGRTFASLVRVPASDTIRRYCGEMVELTRQLAGDVEFVFAFVTLRRPVALPRANLWYWPHSDHARMLRECLAAPLAAALPLFIASGAAKQTASGWGSSDDETAEARTLVALTFARYEWFAAWRGERHRHRSPEYRALKAAFGEQMLERVLACVPTVRADNVAHVEVATPLSYQHYFHTLRGECYGLAMCRKRFEAEHLRPGTPIGGLFLAGQDVCTLGFTGALMSGLLTTAAITGLPATVRTLLF